MTKKLKVYLLIILAAVGAAFALAGCRIGVPDRAEVLAGYSDKPVTYYSNGGAFDGSTTITVRDLYFKIDSSSAGVPFFEITTETSDMKVARKGYDLVGWYLPEVYPEGHAHAGEPMYTYTYRPDQSKEEEVTVPVYPVLKDNGDPVTDSVTDRPVYAREGKEEQILESAVLVVPSETRVDASRLIEKDEELKVCAKWLPSLKVAYMLVCEDGKTYEDTNGKSYKNGDLLREIAFGDGDSKNVYDGAPVNLKGATFAATYEKPDFDAKTDEAMTIIQRPEEYDEENPQILVYAHYLDGDWTVIKNSFEDIRSMFNAGILDAEKKFYLLQDVDCSGMQSVNLKQHSSTQVAKATIVGNGHTFSNVTFSRSGVAGGRTWSVFGVFGASFNVSDFKLENLKISLNGRGEQTLFAVSAGVEEGATFTNFTIDGIQAEVQTQQGLSNASAENKATWLFGNGSGQNYAGGDQGFLNKYTGLTVTNHTLIFK